MKVCICRRVNVRIHLKPELGQEHLHCLDFCVTSFLLKAEFGILSTCPLFLGHIHCFDDQVEWYRFCYNIPTLPEGIFSLSYPLLNQHCITGVKKEAMPQG